MKLSVCVDAIFRGQDTAQAMRQVKAAGYGAYEFWGWWDKDLDAIAQAQRECGLTLIGMCTKFFSLVNPAAHDDFIAGLGESIHAAKKMNCDSLIAQCGQDTGGPREAQRQAMVDALRRAAPLLAQAGVTLLLEPLNLIDHAGYYLTSSEEAAQAIMAVDSPHVRMLFDLYHQQITEGDLLRHVERHLPLIGHIHAAGNPGRGELGTGEIHYPNVLRAIRDMGYQGHVGLEYFPLRPAEEGLREAREMLN